MLDSKQQPDGMGSARLLSFIIGDSCVRMGGSRVWRESGMRQVVDFPVDN